MNESLKELHESLQLEVSSGALNTKEVFTVDFIQWWKELIRNEPLCEDLDIESALSMFKEWAQSPLDTSVKV